MTVDLSYLAFGGQAPQPRNDKPTGPVPQASGGGARVSEFVNQYAPLAQQVGERIGVAPEILLGQWGLETGWGKSVIPGTNNLGNIKDFSGRGPTARDNMTGSVDAYRAYSTPDEFGADFAGLIQRRYKNAVGTGGDAQNFFTALKTAGYAEDPGYIQKGVSATNMVRSALGGQAIPVRDLGRAPAATAPQQPAQATPGGDAFRRQDLGLVQAKAPVGSATAGDYLRQFGASAIEGIGSIVQAAGEVGAAIANRATGTENFEGKNILAPAAQSLRDGMTEGGKQAVADSNIEGSITDLSSIEGPASAQGWAMLAAGGLGSVASSLLPMIGPAARIAKAAKAGDAAALASAQRLGIAVGAGTGAAQTGGAAAEEVRRTAQEQVDSLSHEELLGTVPAYAETFQATGDETQARNAVVNRAAQFAGAGAAIFGAAGGAINAKLLEDIILKQGVTKALGRVGGGVAGRTAIGATGGAIGEGAQETAEKVGQNVGENIALGQEVGDNAFRNTAGDAIAGALTGGMVGGAGGAMSRAPSQPAVVPPVAPPVDPVAAKAAEPNSPLSKAAVAGTDASAVLAPPDMQPPPVDPTARLAELERIANGTAGSEGPDGTIIRGEAGRLFTPEEKAEYDTLREIRDGMPGAVDPLDDRVAAVREQARSARVLDALRLDNAPIDARTFINDLATAASKTVAPEKREVALNRLEQAMEWAGVNPVQQPDAGADALQFGADRDTAALRDRLSTQAGQVTELDQQRLEAAAQTGQQERAQAEARAMPEMQQAAIARAMRNVEERGGVASPYEAQLFEEAGLGQPFDRIDEKLQPRIERAPEAPQVPAMQQPTSPAGIIVERQGARPRPAPVDPAAQQAAAGSAAQDREAAARAERAAAQEAANQQAASRPQVRPPVDDVISALKVEPALRSAEQKALVDGARRTMDAADIELLDSAAKYGAGMSTEQRLRLRELRASKSRDDGRPDYRLPNLTAPAGDGPALVRKRRAQFDDAATNGFTKVERRGDAFVLRNEESGQEIGLRTPADAALARASIREVSSRPAPTVASLTGDRINSNWSRFKPETGTLGIPRSNMPQIAAERRGALVNYLKARGVESEQAEVSPRSLKPTQAEFSPGKVKGARDAGGGRSILVSSDGHVLDGHHQWLAALDDNTPVKVVRLNAPIRRLVALSRTFPSADQAAGPRATESPSAASATGQPGAAPQGAQPDEAPATVEPTDRADRKVISADGKKHEIKLIDPAREPEGGSSPARSGGGRRASRKDMVLVSALAQSIGRRVQFFDAPAGLSVDGFVMPGDASTIYLNRESTISPVAVFGHEFVHTLRDENPAAYDAIAAVVRSRVTNAKGFRADYYGKDSQQAQQDGALDEERGSELEELVADLGGNLMSDPVFWQEVFENIRKDNATQSRGIIADLVARLEQMVALVLGSVKGRKFAADKFVTDMEAIRAAYRDGLSRYIRSSTEQATSQRAEIARSKRRLATNDPRDSGVRYSSQRGDLVALHNLTEANLLNAEKLGGLPVPSIGITKAGEAFDSFGEISLIGGKDLIDPKTGVPVFDADAYTARFPDLLWKAVPSKKAQPIVDRLRQHFRDADDNSRLEEAWDHMVNRPDKTKAVDAIERSVGGKLAYLRSIGESIDIPTRPVPLRNDFAGQPVLVEWVNKNKDGLDQLDRMGYEQAQSSPLQDQFGDVVSKAIDSLYADLENGPVRRDLINSTKSNVIDEDGRVFFGKQRQIIGDVANVGKTEPDRWALDSALNERINPARAKYEAWVLGLFDGIFADPMIEVGRRKVPVTLDNIVEAMTRGKVAGKEKTLAFGNGRTRAEMAKRYKSIEQIQKDRERVVSSERAKAAQGASEKVINEYQKLALQSYTEKNWRGEIDTWGGMDASMRVLGAVGKIANPTDAQVRALLRKEGFAGFGSDVVDAARDSAATMRETPVEYLEAKPQRAVSLNEFAGAVVPADISAEARAVLDKHKIRVETYERNNTEQRREAIDKLSGELDAGEGGVRFSRARTPTKSPASDVRKAEKYLDENGILPYTSEGALSPEVEVEGGPRFSIKREGKYGNHPVLGIPVNQNGTVTLYYPATNEAARKLASEKRLRGARPESNRVYLTNESSGPKVAGNPGNIEQPMDGANVLVQIDPSLVHLDQEHSDGRKDFYVQIAEGESFAGKMRQTMLFTLNAPRTKALTKETKLTDLEKRISTSISEYLGMSPAERRARLREARLLLKREHNVGTLLGENGKLEKTRVGDYGLTYDGKSVSSLGLGLASAQTINEQKLSTCPRSAICESLCLGETSGQNLLYGGEGQFKSGPRLSQYLKTEAMVQHPEEFAIALHAEIAAFTKMAKREDLQPAIRLNVTSDFRPATFEAIISAFPEAMFYDYTKLPSKTIADNHHLTYSSTGASQVINGKAVVNPESNWDKMVERMREGSNVAMAFTSRTDMPDFVVDERTGERFQVWNGDNYDARFLDPKPGDPGNILGRGMVIGLTNKDRTTKPEDAAEKHRGFFLDYDRERDGPDLIIRDQKKLAGRGSIPIVQASRARDVWYHGTTSDVQKFNRIDGGNAWGRGYYLTDDPATASGYAEGTAGGRIRPDGNAGPNVMPVRVADGELFDMLKPVDRATIKRVEKGLGESLKDYTEPGMKGRDLRQVLFEQFVRNQDEANGVLKKAGYIGLVGVESMFGAGRTLMVFDAKSISSDITGEVLGSRARAEEEYVRLPKAVREAAADGVPRYSTKRPPTPDLTNAAEVELFDREIPVQLGAFERRSSDDYRIVMVPAAKFDRAFKRDSDYVGPKGEGGIAGRYDRFREFARETDWIEASVADVTPEGRAVFGNGRHRYAVMRDEGLDWIPIAMSAEARRNAEKHGLMGEVLPRPPGGGERVVPSAKREVPWSMSETNEYERDGARIEYDVLPDFVSVRDAGTDPGRRGRGAFRAAMGDLISKADEEGLPIRLMAFDSTGESDDARLERFYASLGFRETGRDDGAALMERQPSGGDARMSRQRAFHGTPHRGIEKFSTDKIGTGEGAQAYGWGLYFASKREIAEWYREKLSKPRKKDPLSLDGKTLTPAAMRKAGDLYRKLEDKKLTNTPEYAEAVITAKWLDQFTSFKDARAAIARQRELEAEGKNSAGGLFPINTAYWDNLLAWMDANKSRINFPARGQLYEVEIPEDSEMLLWDRPLSEQPPKVREALAAAVDPAVRSSFEFTSNLRPTQNGANGRGFYEDLSDQLGGDQQASEALAALGIKGIKYLDGTSRGAGEGSFNYVIFSGDDVQIQQAFYSRARQAWQQIASSDEAFRYPRSDAKEFSEIAADLTPDLYWEPIDARTERKWEAEVGYKKVAMVVERGDSVHLDVSELKSGQSAGSRIYNLVANYAHNNGKVFIGDPAGLSATAAWRRLSNMISSALKFGTTDHLEPHPNQLDPAGAYEDYTSEEEAASTHLRPLNWRTGDTEHNIEEMLRVESESLHAAIPELKDVAFDFATGQFVDPQGGAVSREALGRIASSPAARSASAGSTTLARAVFTRSVLQGVDDGRLGADGAKLLTSVPDGLNRVLYSRARAVASTPDGWSPARSRPVLSREATVAEGGVNGRAGDAEDLANLLVGQAFRSEGLGGLDAPSQRAVLQGVLGMRKNGEVVRRVVGLLPVDVVNVLGGKERAAERLFGDEAMLKKLLSADSDGAVSTAVDVADALVRAVAVVRAEGAGVARGVPAAARERGAAASAGQGGASVHGLDSIGNDGSFDDNDPSIISSAARTWDTPGASKFDDVVYKMQNRQVDLLRVQQAIKDAGKQIADDFDTYLREELFHGRAAKRTQDFTKRELEPLAQDMADRGLQIEELDEYLHARHAPHANKIVAERNPDNADLQDGGSGMTNQQAADYMANLPADKRAHLEAVAAKVDKIIAGTRKLMVDYELESQETVDGWDKLFTHYVPLMREDDGDAPARLGTGQGYSVKGRETKSRTGSKKKVVDVLANIAMQRERVIVRGEKNRVAQSLVKLAEENKNKDFWDTGRAPTIPTYDPAKGVVVQRPDPMYKTRPNVVVAKFRQPDGSVREEAVRFNEDNARAMRTAAVMKNLEMDRLEGLLGASAAVTRYFAAINTQLNPIFGVVNFIRDFQNVLINMKGTPLDGKQKQIAADAWAMTKGIWTNLRTGKLDTAEQKLWDEFQSVGGQTGFRQMFADSGDRADDIRSAINPDYWMDSKFGKVFTANGALKMPVSKASKIVKAGFQALTDYNDTLENAMRLSIYKAGKESGLSKEQAASIAKNASVNFNRRGQVAQQAGALYAFFNAAMQGTARMGQLLFTMEPGKPRTLRLSRLGKRIVAGGVMIGVMQALALSAAGFSEDDPPQFLRERSIIIPTFDGKYVSVPMPLGLHILPNLGRVATEWAMGGFNNTPERAVGMIGMFADAFNPIGNAGLSMQTLAPTALDPLVALTENKDWQGRPIAKESLNPATPGHALARDTATSWAIAISKGVNTLTGGNDYVAGAISPVPDQVDYLLGQLTGGVGREISKVEQTLTATITGEELPTHKIPLFGRFGGSTKSQQSEGADFYANSRKLNELETEIKGLQKDGKLQEAAKLRARPEALLIVQMNRAERDISKLRRQKTELVRAGAPREQVREIEERITARMAAMNRAAEALKGGQ